MKEYHDIYDRIAKRCLTLSNRAIIRFINGVYGTDHSLDSTVTYNWTEHTDKELKRTLADTIITINGKFGYHTEFQMEVGGSISFRILEYGFHHAMKQRGEGNVLEFPEPVLIYLYEGQDQPDIQNVIIRFGSQGEFPYRIPVIKYLNLSQRELEEKKLIILIPFQLLKLRKEMEKKRTPENLEALKKLVNHDIIEAINRNLKAENISSVDAQKLIRLTQQLFHHIYDRYPEIAEEGVGEEVDEALILDVDIIELEITQRVTEEVTQKVTDEVTQKVTEEYARQLHQKEQELQILKLFIQGKTPEEISKETGLAEEVVRGLLT